MTRLETLAHWTALCRRLLRSAFVVALIGAAVTLAVGSNVDGVLGTTGVILVLAAFGVALVATPTGFILTILAMRLRARLARQTFANRTPEDRAESAAHAGSTDEQARHDLR